ncbi:MAG: tRNA (adenosine(37)-N6)-threonylcarbamoyltransferase complex transferase subunit TsaD [Thermoguttaceae bacterium]|nr:tRNA (adenosine(37)-N6)-threonylcarbamoyltransferase complex transferase subunit TsaD [Thermoguttaceae bacterium]
MGMKILTIESSCDETAAAVVGPSGTGVEVFGAALASQIEIHQKYGGVVPEIASRAHMEAILPVVAEALERASTPLDELDAIAVVNAPGLAGSLLVGLTAAKALCVATGKPLIAINHLQAHIYACKVAFDAEIFPCVGLIASGGHSSLYRCAGPIDFELLGTTIDDAAGEAFDKVASMLGLPYPGGPSIQAAAEKGDAKAFPFPRPMLNEPEKLQFSFSGLKTAVRYKLYGTGKVAFTPVQAAASDVPRVEPPGPEFVADVAASFQEAVVDCLVGKSLHALKKCGMRTLCVGGGVAANARFREKMAAAAEKKGVKLYIAPPKLCTDNAVMGAIAIERFQAGLFETLDLDVSPGLIRMT